MKQYNNRLAILDKLNNVVYLILSYQPETVIIWRQILPYRTDFPLILCTCGI